MSEERPSFFQEKYGQNIQVRWLVKYDFNRFQCKNLFSSLDHSSIHPIFAPEMGGLDFGTKTSHSQTGAFYAGCFFLEFFLLGIVVGDVFTFYYCRSCSDHVLLLPTILLKSKLHPGKIAWNQTSHLTNLHFGVPCWFSRV